MSTIQFLKACNKIFERGILAKKGFVKDSSSPLIKSMEDGFSYFIKWLDEKLIQGKNIIGSLVIVCFACGMVLSSFILSTCI